MVGSLQKITVRRYRQEVGVSKDRQLSFELEQISFGGAVKLTLLRCRVAPIALGDVAGDCERRTNDGVGSSLRFSTCAVLDDAQDFAAKGDCLLPDFEVP